ncbi:MAG TPA: DEAD/DEAH box helicase, partial [Salinivirgaceae bacterium]|nr:DEAD/DEAH box helicase [Salinivirgaceae bacterium]
LCLQITRDLENYSLYVKDLNIVAVYGGANIVAQIQQLRRGCQIVVGTPGRVIDLLNRKALDLSSIKRVILDEADEMLNMGFIDDLDTILAQTPEEKQTWLFSATMPPEIARIAKKYMKNPIEIAVGKKNQGAENVHHQYYLVHAKDKYEALKRICDVNPDIYGIVFCRTRQETKEVAEKLMTDGYNADALHGDLSQAQRDQVMQRFRSKHLQMLVATDVAARGIDVENITHIINYNLPDDPEVYIHRSGRTGRAGRTGVSISIIHAKEQGKLRMIENMLKKNIVLTPVPTGKEICQKQLMNLIDKVEKVTINPEVAPYLDMIYKKLQWLDRDELIQHFVSVEFNRFLEYYKNSPDLNIKKESKSKERNTQSFSDREIKKHLKADRFNDRLKKSFSVLKINIGKKHGLKPTKLIGIINDRTRNRDIRFGKIDIFDTITMLEVSSQHVQEVANAIHGITAYGETLTVMYESKTRDHKIQKSTKKRH